MQNNGKIKITINNQSYDVENKLTILHATQQNDIFIPHLCFHPELSPYGGCRLCIVEVDGVKGYPTACTTQVKDGMTIRTHSKILQEMRTEILQLILSEHPSACLICDEAEECSDYQGTIRKVGFTTGCRWCPKDKDCELQKVVEYLKIDEIEFPVYYRNLPVEKKDPFFDRDYNLCIYCGRCVRICHEHRKSSIISLNNRGRYSTIGPAFNQSHLDANCEFCGACVSVCPTGTLSEKTKKWSGIPEKYNSSICSLCGLNCDIQILTKENKVIGTLPLGDPHLTGGELCVKGRFCLIELVNNPDRILEPQYQFPEGLGFITWEEAFLKASDKLKKADGNKVAVYLSPNLTLEEIVAAKQFAQQVIKTINITSSVLTNNLIPYISLAEKSISIEKIEKSESIISLFLNGNYNYAPVTLAIKRAAEKGIPYLQIGWINDTTSRFASHHLTPETGKEKEFVKEIVESFEKGKEVSPEISEVMKLFKDSSSTIILGPTILDLTEAKEILRNIEKIIKLTGSKLFVLNPYGNLPGLLSSVDLKPHQDILDKISKGKIDSLYLIGDSPFKKRPNVNFIIHQSPFPPSEKLKPDLILPTATWSEISGTYVTLTDKRKKLKAVVKTSEKVLSNSAIFAKLAKKLGKQELKFNKKELSKLIPKKLTIKLPEFNSKPKKNIVQIKTRAFPYTLIQEKNLYTYMGMYLNQLIEGLREIEPEETLIINPIDASKFDIQNGDNVMLKSHKISKKYPVVLRKTISPGFIRLITSNKTFEFETNPCPVKIRRVNV
ncbi:MAG: (2Fe-2S)-binding protein [Armatimonadetes bacterium]|nr:(2Fe-2S)-binding protein [Armatimonadota bacterium]